MAAYHLEGGTLLWYQIFKDEHEIVTWTILKQGLHERFGPTLFEDFLGDLTKLSKLVWYEITINSLRSSLCRARNLFPLQQVSCFVSGLKESIMVDVLVQNLQTLSIAIGLAHLSEPKHAVHMKPGQNGTIHQEAFIC
uniref:Retrotransposon gag domain-containing protein n=1 Tax=Nelumbo nucifera TaxID=4432 RepID=A0A822ZTF1_NELNU|nr:TPA_asm: hypothetical protein HUJ06_017747 [Nelumbo nucifera]